MGTNLLAPTRLEGPDLYHPAADSGVRRLPPIGDRPEAPSVPGETLEEAWNHAGRADAELHAARHRLLARRAKIRGANALGLPRMTVGGSYSLRSDELALAPATGSPFLPGQLAFTQREGVMLGGVVDYPLYTGGQVSQSVQAAQLESSAAELALMAARRDLRISVAQAFLRVLEAETMLHTADTSLASLQAHLHDVERFYDQKMAPRTDVLQARAAVADARQRRLGARHALQMARADYNRAVGRPHDHPVQLRCPDTREKPQDVQQLVHLALKNRPELAQMACEAEALKRRAAAAEANNRPQVHAGAAYWFEENRFRSPEGLGSLGVTAMWNVYDGHHYGHEASALRHQAAAIERLRAGLVEQIGLDIRQAWLRCEEADCGIAEAAESVRQAEENLRTVQHRYRVGMATAADVLAAEATRTRCLQRVTRARYRSLLAEFELRAAAGVL